MCSSGCRRSLLLLKETPRMIGPTMRPFFGSASGAATSPEWERCVADAEKVVGYPTSFGNLRWLMSDEVANVALHLRKLVGTDHPILKIAKDLLHSGRNNLQAWGLLVLLVSKAAGHTPQAKKMEMVEAGGILQDQRTYAEITEIIRTGHMVHKGLINVRHADYSSPASDDDTSKDSLRQNMIFGNKIALLTGDFLLATANAMLSGLRDSHLSALISSALRDLTESEFVGERDSARNEPLPARPREGRDEKASEAAPAPFNLTSDAATAALTLNARGCCPLATDGCLGVAEREWTLRHVLGGASLLGRGCEGALHLGGHSQEVQDLGYTFGCRAALAWQAARDLESFADHRKHRRRDEDARPFSLASAPVLFALRSNPSLYDEASMGGAATPNYAAIGAAASSRDALDATATLQRAYAAAATSALDAMLDAMGNKSEASTVAAGALRKVVLSTSTMR